MIPYSKDIFIINISSQFKNLIMKKLEISSITFLFAIFVLKVQAQKTEKAEVKETKKELKGERVALRKLEGTCVSDVAKKSFNEDFGNVPNVKWKREENFDIATFIKDGKEIKAYYDIEGKLVGTTSQRTFADLPTKGQLDIKPSIKTIPLDKFISLTIMN